MLSISFHAYLYDRQLFEVACHFDQQVFIVSCKHCGRHRRPRRPGRPRISGRPGRPGRSRRPGIPRRPGKRVIWETYESTFFQPSWVSPMAAILSFRHLYYPKITLNARNEPCVAENIDFATKFHFYVN